MNPQCKKSLRQLKDQELLLQADSLVEKERATTLEVLQHLREIEVRRLFVECGYTSMYEMCLKRYKYSEGQAQRRISAARLLTELPEITDKVQDGSLNITTLSKVQSFLRTEKKAQHSHQPELLKAQFQPNAQTNLDTESFMKFEALLNQENQILLAEFKDLFAHELSGQDPLSILQWLLQKALAQKKKKLGLETEISRKDPEKNSEMKTKNKTESKTEKRTEKKVEDKAENKNPTKNSNAPLPSSAKVISPQRPKLSVVTKRALWQRAEACCEHVDPVTKQRCSSQHALEQDHIQPVALGGSHALDNLALHCRTHNARRAVKTFGVFEPSV